MTEQPGVEGRAAAVAGVVALPAAVGISFVILRAVAGGDTPVMILGLASLFFGQMAFDIGVAASFAASRLRGQVTGNYSSAAALGVTVLFPWIALASTDPTDHQGSFLTSPLALVLLGPACIMLQFFLINRLHRVGRSSPPA